MTDLSTCPECGASWLDGLTCQDHFHQMLAWESEYSALLEVHHLAVLCYHLQHPSLYSPEGLAGARGLLADLVLRGAITSAGVRKYQPQGTPEAHGAYPQRPPWTLTSPDVTAGGPEQYIENVRSWAQSVEEALSKNEG